MEILFKNSSSYEQMYFVKASHLVFAKSLYEAEADFQFQMDRAWGWKLANLTFLKETTDRRWCAMMW